MKKQQSQQDDAYNNHQQKTAISKDFNNTNKPEGSQIMNDPQSIVGAGSQDIKGSSSEAN